MRLCSRPISLDIFYFLVILKMLSAVLNYQMKSYHKHIAFMYDKMTHVDCMSDENQLDILVLDWNYLEFIGKHTYIECKV